MSCIFIGKYCISIQPSIFTSRQGETDIRISEESKWGGREKNGKYYLTSLVMDARDYTTIRSYCSVPDDIILAAKTFFESGVSTHQESLA
ncbi:MAG: hypothetical protein M1346_01120 [Gammaproteobacteria bacterium]|nr:hypothetical protein [Gammaproteobacteria bacterium]